MDKNNSNAPRDKYFLTFLIFIIHGIGTLTAWNIIITAKSYFVNFKLVNSSRSARFLSDVGFAAQIPNVLFNWLNVFVNIGGDATKRIVVTLSIEMCLFGLTVALAMLDSTGWTEAFFWITIVSVVILNAANGVYQNTMFGVAAKLPFKYIGAIILGNNIGGLITAIVSILNSFIFGSYRTEGIYLFLTAILIHSICLQTYLALPLNRFYRDSVAKSNAGSAKKDPQEKISLWAVFKAAFPQLFNVFFVYFVTLSVFPAVHSDIKRTNPNFFLNPGQFISFTCFLTFNLFAMIGSLVTNWIQWPPPKYLVIPVVLRVLFMPLFLFCNYRPIGVRRTLPVYIPNEWAYWVIASLMSFTNGYCGSLSMMYTPRIVEESYQLPAGKFAAAILVTGVFSGVLFSYVFPLLV